MPDLKQTLRDAADALTPAFDDDLHASTLRRVHASRRERLASNIAGQSSVRRWPFVALASAVACIAIIALAVTFLPEPDVPEQRLVIDMPDFTEAGPIRRTLASPVLAVRRDVRAIGADTQRLAGFVIDQLRSIHPGTEPGSNL